jgi:hypothetical protein
VKLLSEWLSLAWTQFWSTLYSKLGKENTHG